jgi:hypothetical protein
LTNAADSAMTARNPVSCDSGTPNHQLVTPGASSAKTHGAARTHARVGAISSGNSRKERRLSGKTMTPATAFATSQAYVWYRGPPGHGKKKKAAAV